jgi:DNA mismatch repair protein MutS
MEIDSTTLNDLSIFNNEEEFSVFNKLNFCTTVGGKERLYDNYCTPLSTIEAIQGIQDTVKKMLALQQYWPNQISNGTVLMIEKFFSATIDEIPENPSISNALAYKLLHGPDFSFVKYSTEHIVDFLCGLQQIVKHFLTNDCPTPLKNILLQIQTLLQKEEFSFLQQYQKAAEIPLRTQLALAHFIRYRFKQNTLHLLYMFYQLDAWYGMAMGVQKYKLVFPTFTTQQKPLLQVSGLYHPLLPNPVDYTVALLPDKNFLFLTGANMAGKSTFIKSIGTAVFLAHLGMGVPASSMELSIFDGLLSNINVMDNIVRGESYFYNEVQRIKATVQKISDGRNWFILIDELFKGTNVQDAMKCSTTVIEGFLKTANSTFILSTHLYEIAEPLKTFNNITFNYFETTSLNDELIFSYQLKEGISNDRLGYLILKREGVVNMLHQL